MPEDLDELVRRWSEAERRLYPVVLSDPAAYERGVRAASLLADELKEVVDLESLPDAWPGAARRAARQLQQLGGSGDAAVAELVAGAAFAIRYRELAAEARAAEMARRVADAARRGERWVVVDQVGSLDLACFGHFRRLEMHLPGGMGISSYTEEQVDTDTPRLILERVPLDPTSGRPRGEAAERREAADMAGWEAAHAELRAVIEGAGAGPAGALDRVGKPEGG
ncbi:MAG TPA: hypothetical protein VFW71_04370 [Actinomycetota bacterium]|nr:hypothetical protein [Actinomycetota bacterium]